MYISVKYVKTLDAVHAYSKHGVKIAFQRNAKGRNMWNSDSIYDYAYAAPLSDRTKMPKNIFFLMNHKIF